MRSWVLACVVVAACGGDKKDPAPGSDRGPTQARAGSGSGPAKSESADGSSGSATANGSGGSATGSGGAGSAATGASGSGGGGSGSGSGGIAASLEAHRLFQCAMTSGDQALIVRVTTKLGLSDAKGAPNDKFQPFVKLHGDWVRSNLTKLKELAPTPAAAKACAEAGLK